jgi:cytochrome o ubiquinol oxidase subunit 2
MRFTARASTETEFSQWVYSTKSSGEKLTSDMYKDLLLPSEANPVQTYSSYDNDIYDNVIVKYAGMSEGHSHNSEDSEEGDSH